MMYRTGHERLEGGDAMLAYRGGLDRASFLINLQPPISGT